MAKRIWVSVAACAMFAVVTAVPWSKVTRETRFDGGVQREYLILGQIQYASMSEDARITASDKVFGKLNQYGIKSLPNDGQAVVEAEGAKSRFVLFAQREASIRAEASRVTKEMPWLKLVWHGARSTSFYARGHHPKLGGFVEVSCGRLPDRPHRIGQVHFSISVTE